MKKIILFFAFLGLQVSFSFAAQFDNGPDYRLHKKSGEMKLVCLLPTGIEVKKIFCSEDALSIPMDHFAASATHATKLTLTHTQTGKTWTGDFDALSGRTLLPVPLFPNFLGLGKNEISYALTTDEGTIESQGAVSSTVTQGRALGCPLMKVESSSEEKCATPDVLCDLYFAKADHLCELP